MRAAYGNQFLKVFLVIVLCVAVTAYYAVKQPQIQAGDGKGWDGIHYQRLYAHMAGEIVNGPIEFPFCKRVGLPYLAAQLPLSAERSFLVINVLSGLGASLLVYLILARAYSFILSIACLLPMLFYLFAPLRFPYFYPFTVDPPAMFFYALAAFMYRRSLLGAVFSLVISGFFREAGFYFAGMLIVYSVIQHNERRGQLISILVLVIAMFSLNFIQGTQCHGSQLIAGFENGLTKVSRVDEWLKVTAALLMTCGAFMVSSYRRGAIARKDNTSDDILVSIVMFVFAAFLAIVGGSDTTRIFFVAYPLYVQFLAWSCREAKGWQIIMGSICGLVANSAPRRIPEPTNYWPKNDIDGFFAFFPDASHVAVSTELIIFWGICLLMVSRMPALGVIVHGFTDNFRVEQPEAGRGSIRTDGSSPPRCEHS